MKSNRRSVLIGLGALTVGGGAVFGTGAFSSVDAERTVSVETAGDASAILALEPARTGEEFVNESEGTIEINLDGTDDDSDGINQNARTRFENLVRVTNNGTQTVDSLELEIEVSETEDDVGHEDAFKITVGENTLDPTSGEPVEILGVGDNDLTLGPEDDATFGVEIDLLIEDGIDDIEDNAEFTLTITANTQD